MDPGTTCSTHLEARAGWSCTHCQTLNCPDCVADVRGFAVCAVCGLLADRLIATRAEAEPFSRVWPRALAELLGWGPVHIVVMAAALQFMFLLGPEWWYLGRALEIGWVLFLARRTGAGLPAFGAPGWEDLFSIWLGPFGRVLVGAAPVWVWAAVLGGSGMSPVAATRWEPWALAVLAVVMLPAALVMSSVEGSGRQVPWPPRLLRFARDAGADLLPVTAAVGVGVLGDLVAATLPPLQPEDTRIDVAIFALFAARLVSFLGFAVAGMMAGLLVRARATEWGHRDDEPDQAALIDEAPRGTWTPAARPSEEAAHQEEAGHDEEAAVQEEDARAARFARIELEVAPEPRTPEALATAVRDGLVPVSELATERAVEVAQVYAGQGDFSRAADVLRMVVSRPDDPHVARAMVILARLLGERLDDPPGARHWFSEVSRRFPDTPAARFATEQLQTLA